MTKKTPSVRNNNRPEDLERLEDRAAGIDIGSRFHVVAVPESAGNQPVRSFPSFTSNLHEMAEWLIQCKVKTVAMESTGIYWVAAFDIIQSKGLKVILVNARDVKTVPGRKTDVNDAQWLQKLHSYGLLRASFQPEAKIAALRTILRHRDRLIENASSFTLRMQKILMQMNIQLHHVVSDMMGRTGMAILKAIIAGEHDPKVLARCRDPRCKSSSADIEAALTGHYRPENLLVLKQNMTMYDYMQDNITECDMAAEKILQTMQDGKAKPKDALPEERAQKTKNEPKFNSRTLLYNLLGQDLTQIHGLGGYSVMRLIAECGEDMSKWPSSKHFASWLGLSPGNKISGGRLLSAKSRRTTSRASTIFRMAAMNIGKTKTALGAFYRRLAVRTGKAKAITATARKLAILFYNSLRHGMKYVDPGVSSYEQRYKDRVVRSLKKRASEFGFVMCAVEAGTAP